MWKWICVGLVFANLGGGGGGAGAGEKKPPLRVCLISGAAEYRSDQSFMILKKYLEAKDVMVCTTAFARSENDLPGLEHLGTCDVAVLFTRRLKLQGEPLERLKKYCQSGKPLVAIRTASHGIQTWLDLDHAILGGNYKMHYPEGPLTTITIAPGALDHPILNGFKPYSSKGSLYRNTGLAKDVDILLTGSIPGHSEPIAWTRMVNGGRLFYTSLGHPQDFQEESFLLLLQNAIFWTTQRAAPTP